MGGVVISKSRATPSPGFNTLPAMVAPELKLLVVRQALGVLRTFKLQRPSKEWACEQACIAEMRSES